MESQEKSGGSHGFDAVGGNLFMKRRAREEQLATGVGLAVLAAEYPEKFEMVRRSMPDYFDRGMRVILFFARAGMRISDAAGQTVASAARALSQGLQASAYGVS